MSLPGGLAAQPAQSRGRLHLEVDAAPRGPRDLFQRDRDRIVHSVAFRRLRHKTQVFVAPDGDHYRVRLTHSLEVAQIGRVIARALGIDEDLTEALCLAHDIGHPPFGHAGEEALDNALLKSGGFDHNAHCLRVLMRLESPYCEHNGLNLSWEVLEGLAKHNGPLGMVPWALAELDADYPLDLTTWPSLEAQVASLADDIAYDNHDIDDGLRAGFLQLDQLLSLDFVADQWRAIERKFPAAPQDRRLRELVRGQIGLMVNDVIGETSVRVKDFASVQDVRGAGHASVAFSAPMGEQERRLKAFMYDALYHHPQQLLTANRARAVTAELYAAYAQDPELMESNWAARTPYDEPACSRHIADFIAGMTDRYAIAAHAKIYGETPEDLRHV
jgi:dGTPase